MKLKRVTIKGFRSIVELDLDVPDLLVLLGRNNAGKSNVLRALRCFFTPSDRALTEQDRCQLPDFEGGETYVECTFGDLADAERDNLAKYIMADGSVRVRRTIEELDGKLKSTLHGYVSQPVPEWLRAEFDRYSDAEFWRGLGIDPLEYVANRPARGRITRPLFDEFRQTYIERHRDHVQFEVSLSTTEFKGRQSAGLKALPTFTFVPATGDVAEIVVGRSTSLLNIMVAEVLATATSSEQYQEAAQAIARAASLVNQSESRLAILNVLERHIEEQLSPWQCRVQIATSPAELTKILVDGLSLAIDDGTNTPLVDKGSGIQRQVLFQVFRAFADFRSGRGVFEGRGGTAQGTSHIIAFEEPELFLHPQAQEAFYDDLERVSATDQILVTTHSNLMVRVDRPDSIRILRRETNTAPTRVYASDPISGDDRERFKEINLFTPDVSRMFFADKIVLLEGPADVIYVSETAKMVGCFDRRVALVAAGGKNNIPIIQRVLNRFRIPYLVVYDADRPDHPDQQRQTAAVVSRIREGREQGVTCNNIEFHPTCAAEIGCAEGGGDKVFKAVQFTRTMTPPPEFVAKVGQIFTI